MRKFTRLQASALFAMSVLSIGLAAAPAVAQDAMAKDSMDSGEMKMSPMAMKKMKKCSAMSHDMMMKSASCMKMMKAHPDMMKGDSSMMAH